MAGWEKNISSRLARSIVTAVATAQTNASQTTTPIGSQTRQVRVSHTLPNPIWITFGSTSVTATANSDHELLNQWADYFTVTPGQCMAFISTSTSTGYVCLSELTN